MRYMLRAFNVKTNSKFIESYTIWNQLSDQAEKYVLSGYTITVSQE